MELQELIDKLQSLKANKNAKIIVVDSKERLFDIKNVDTIIENEVVIDIIREKEDYKS